MFLRPIRQGIGKIMKCAAHVHIWVKRFSSQLRYQFWKNTSYCRHQRLHVSPYFFFVQSQNSSPLSRIKFQTFLIDPSIFIFSIKLYLVNVSFKTITTLKHYNNTSNLIHSLRKWIWTRKSKSRFCPRRLSFCCCTEKK